VEQAYNRGEEEAQKFLEKKSTTIAVVVLGLAAMFGGKYIIEKRAESNVGAVKQEIEMRDFYRK
jgi:hypothetical protein